MNPRGHLRLRHPVKSVLLIWQPPAPLMAAKAVYRAFKGTNCKTGSSVLPNHNKARQPASRKGAAAPGDLNKTWVQNTKLSPTWTVRSPTKRGLTQPDLGGAGAGTGEASISGPHSSPQVGEFLHPALCLHQEWIILGCAGTSRALSDGSILPTGHGRLTPKPPQTSPNVPWGAT